MPRTVREDVVNGGLFVATRRTTGFGFLVSSVLGEVE